MEIVFIVSFFLKTSFQLYLPYRKRMWEYVNDCFVCCGKDVDKKIAVTK
jgi:hypothetical protein